MVSKITIIEPRFDGAEFGTNTFHGVEPADEAGDARPEDRTERRPSTNPFRAGRFPGMAVLTFVLLLGVVGARRLRNVGMGAVGIERSPDERGPAESR